jgi:uncharacterized protein YyaL (SSP411 family)
MDSAFQQFRRSFDSKLGGFGGAPKFPRPSVHNFLLRYGKRTGNEEALDMVATTLIAMAKGGMNDQLGGGFHRYSVDEYWFVPHFEKMLYDQAQLVISYLEAFQITRGQDLETAVFETAARRTLDYVMREMTAPEGGFWSAEDADSAVDPAKPAEKSEGFFYIWSWGELAELLGEESAQWFAFRYGMERAGNVRNDPHQEFTGLNILFQAHTLEETAHHFDRSTEQIAAALASAEHILFAARAKRMRPHLDDKVLTAWNGLMISAFAKAAAILDEPRYANAARRAADFIIGTLRRPDGSLLRRYRAGDAGIPGMLDDYAFFAQALIDLYEATSQFQYLAHAIAVMDKQRELLEDPRSGGFYASAQADAASLMRLKDDYDGAEPSGNSVALMNLLRLGRITGREDLEASARKLIAAFQEGIAAAPFAMPQMLCACEYRLVPPREIVVAGEAGQDQWHEMLRLLWRDFDPHRTLLHAAPELAGYQPAIAEMRAAGDTTVYVCENFVCHAPARNAADLARLLK